MQLGVTFPQTEIGTDPTAIRDFAQAVEDLGFSFLVFYDHVLGADPDRPGGWTGIYDKSHAFHEPLVTFAYLAALTKRIRLMTSILVLPQRQTVLVAKQAAEVDLLSGGRLELGVGNGWNEVEFEALGSGFRDRGARLEEQVTVLRELWRSDAVSLAGRWHRITAAGINPRPARCIPLWLGGGSDAVLRRTARIADGWMPGGRIQGPRDAIPAAAKLRGYLEAEGRAPTSFPILGGLMATPTSTPEKWRAAAARWREAGATHLTLHTMGAGFEELDQHLAVIRLFRDELAG